MRVLLTLMRRELSSYFMSLTGYLIIAAATFLSGLCLVDIIEKILLNPMPMPLNELFFGTWYPWIVLIPVAPLVTMRVFAQEKAAGTYESLMTAPVRDGSVVLAKFAAAMFYYAILWLPLFGSLLIIQHFSVDSPPPDFHQLGSSYLGLLLVGGLLVAFGCLASSLTQSQAVAAILGVGFNLSLFILATNAEKWSSQLGVTGSLVDCIAITDQLQDFARGVLDTRPIVFFLSFTLFFLFLTLRVVESRRWK